MKHVLCTVLFAAFAAIGFAQGDLVVSKGGGPAMGITAHYGFVCSNALGGITVNFAAGGGTAIIPDPKIPGAIWIDVAGIDTPNPCRGSAISPVETVSSFYGCNGFGPFEPSTPPCNNVNMSWQHANLVEVW